MSQILLSQYLLAEDEGKTSVLLDVKRNILLL